MIFHPKPIADIFSLAINRQFFVVADVQNQQWNQLLRKVMTSKIIASVADDDRQTIGVIIGTHEVITRSF